MQQSDEQEKIDVLDHGFVKLVDSMGDDKSVVNSARVSYKGLLTDTELTASDKKLIKSLITRGHTSPFESVTLTFAVKAPIFVLRQWHRHRTWSFNEVSARYTELPEEYYVPEMDIIGHQMEHEKQMRDTSNISLEAVNIARILNLQNQDAFVQYRQLIELGTPRELARTVLPVATYSSMYATVNLHNLMRFLILRQDAHAQYEIQVYANALSTLAKLVVPHSMSVFEEQQQGETK